MVFSFKSIFVKTAYVCGTLLLVLPYNTHAQSSGSIFEPSVEISISPDNPIANSQITATLHTNAFSTNDAFIGWALNGKVLDQGTGKSSFTFTLGDTGGTVRLEAVIQPAGSGDVIRKSTTITPADIDIIAEPQGYIPPFYEGGVRPALQSSIIFTIIPHITLNGARVPASDLTYTWSKNKSVVEQYSGYGKYVNIINLDFLSRPFTLTVEAHTLGNEVSVSKSISINPRTPELIVYEEDPLLGTLSQKALEGTVSLSSDELWLRAVPYWSDLTDRNSGKTQTTWQMNGTNVQSGPLEETLVLRRPDGVETGKTNIALSIDNQSKILQALQKSFSVLIEPVTQATPTL